MKNLFPRPAGRCLVLLLALLLPGAFQAAAQNVGIGTPSPTQKLDVDGNLRVRGLNGSTNRLPMILPDGTLGVNTSVGRGVPVPLGSVATDAGPQGLAVSGTLAYVVTQSHSLQVFNVASPSAPTPLGTASTGPNTFPVGVAVNGTKAYVVTSQPPSRLQVFDVSNSAAPVFQGSVGVGDNANSVAVVGTTVYVVSSATNTLQIIDAANPMAPTILSTTGTDATPVQLSVSGTLAYVLTTNGRTLQIFNVATPGAPVLVSRTVVSAGFPNGLALSGGIAHVVVGGELKLYDVTTPAAPVLLGTVAATGNQVAVSGTQAYTYNFSTIQVFDTSVPSAPTLIGSLALGGPALVYSGATGYLANASTNTLRVLGAGTGGRTVLANPDGSLSSSGALSFAANGNVGINNPAPAFNLDVTGTIRATGTVTGTSFVNSSDRRFKTHIRPLAGALAGVLALRGVRYEWNALGIRHGGTAGAGQVGLIAQEIEAVYPELVHTDAQGFKAVNYAQLTPVLIEAIKELAACNALLEAQATADHADLLTMKQQLARLLSETAPAGTQARR